MQLGSILATACSLKQYLYLNNVDKLNVIFNVWYEYIWQILIWAAGVLTDWKWRYFGPPPRPSPQSYARWIPASSWHLFAVSLQIALWSSDPQRWLFYGSCLIKLVFIHLSILRTKPSERGNLKAVLIKVLQGFGSVCAFWFFRALTSPYTQPSCGGSFSKCLRSKVYI